MADTTFVNGTPIVPAWLNDVNDHVYNTADVINVRLAPYNAVGNGVADDTAALQAAITAAQSDVQGAAKRIYIPSGKYKITSPLTISKQYIAIKGDGKHNSQILFDGVANCITTSSMNYLRCMLEDFGMVGNSSSGYGLNLNNLNPALPGQCYESVFRNLSIISGDTSFFAKGTATNSMFFNNIVENVDCYSYNGHCFHTANGPGNVYISCYAKECPAGKAGYRMAGVVNLISCNGLNQGDVWGAFGSEPGGSDGFQNDFGFTDYILLNMYGCNVERFGARTTNGIGIRICNNYRVVNILGGAFQRADADIPLGANSYKAIISCRYGPNQSGNPIKFGPGALYLRDVINGTGTNTPSLAHFYFENGGHIEDTSLIAAAANIISYYVASDSIAYPTTRNKLINDIYGGYAEENTALSPRRLSVQHVRYTTGAALTPVGANQAINVTGKTKVVVTPAAAASISTATFTATPGDNSTDYGRNGELLIEAGNSNLTIKHSASGANTFNLTTGTDLTLGTGDVVQFLRSEAGGNWRQVGGTSTSITQQYTMDNIFHNPYIDLWTANGTIAGPPDGFTIAGGVANSANPGVGAYPGNPVGGATSVRATIGAANYASSLMIVPSAQPWNANDQVSFMIAICVEVGQGGARVLFDNGSTQTVIGDVSANGAWQVIRGTGTLIAGNNWKIAVASHDGTNYVTKQLFVGGVTIVRGNIQPLQIADSLGRRNWVSDSITYTPPFRGCTAYITGTGKWYLAANNTAPTDWVLLN